MRTGHHRLNWGRFMVKGNKKPHRVKGIWRMRPEVTCLCSNERKRGNYKIKRWEKELQRHETLSETMGYKGQRVSCSYRYSAATLARGLRRELSKWVRGQVKNWFRIQQVCLAIGVFGYWRQRGRTGVSEHNQHLEISHIRRQSLLFPTKKINFY